MLRNAYSPCPSLDTREFADVAAGPACSRAHSSHREPPCRIPVPASVGADVTIWQVPHPGDYSGSNAVNALTSEDWAEIGAMREGATRRRAFGMRSFLREALSASLGGAVKPGEWRFGRSMYGKPHVADGLLQIEFSISHTEHISLLAISRRRLGIDVEARAVTGWREIAVDHFSRRERAMLNRAPAAAREEVFLRIWTAKEAYAKLLGVGLAFDVPANDCGPGTDLASWSTESLCGRVVVSLAIDQSVGGNETSYPRAPAKN
jgi:4'-phosphopantetheinyl transferase